MPKFTLFTLLVALVVVGGAVIWTFRDRVPLRLGQPVQTAASIATKDGSQELVADQADSLAQLTQEFGDDYAKAISNDNQAAAEAAKNLLSEHGRNVVETDADLVTGLQRFTRNLGAPRQIEVTTNRQQSEHFAEVTTSWRYADTTLRRYLYFTLENGAWKLDSIQEVQQ